MKLDDIKKIAAKADQALLLADPKQFHTALQAAGLEPGAIYQELEMSSRFVDTHRDVSLSNAQVSLHSHAFYEILYCHNAPGVEYLVESTRYRLRRGDIIFVPPEVSHRPLLPARMDAPYERDVLWISQEFMQYIRQFFPDDPLFDVKRHYQMRTEGTKWEFLGEMFRRGVWESEHRHVGWEAAVVGNTLQLVVALRRAATDQTAAMLTAEKPELLDRVVGYIEENLSQKITLGDTAKHFYVSQSTISHIFKEKTGASFYRYVTQRRLIAAKALILQDVPLEHINEKVGFSDYSTFYRAFKQEYGISPRQYRKIQD